MNSCYNFSLFEYLYAVLQCDTQLESSTLKFKTNIYWAAHKLPVNAHKMGKKERQSLSSLIPLYASYQVGKKIKKPSMPYPACDGEHTSFEIARYSKISKER